MPNYPHSSENPNPEVEKYRIIPMGCCLYVVTRRIMRPFRFLLALRMAFPSGGAIVTPEEISAIGLEIGIRDPRTIHRYMEVLQAHGFLRYRGGRLRLWSLYKKFPAFKRGIRYFPRTMNLRETIFAGLVLFFIRLNRSTKRKSASRPGRIQCAHYTDGLSLNFLSKILQLSRVRCSQLKKNPYLLVEHRFEPTTLTKFDVLHLRNDEPAQGRKYVVRRGKVYRQLTDRITVEGVEFGRRRVA